MLLSLGSLTLACSGDDGANGANGSPGANGTAGAAGTTGPAGAQGPAGPAGTSATTPEAGTPTAPNAVYMLSNDPTQNEIIAFTRGDDGSLTAFGSFGTGGAGSGSGLGDQGALAFDSATNNFYAVNAGDNSISMLHLETDGRINLISKIASGGTAPDSITFNGNHVYVLNAGSPASAPNITGFTVEPAGFVALPNSTASLTGASTVGGSQILYVANGGALVVTERLSNNIDVFALTADGVPSTAAPTKVFAEPGPSGQTPGAEPLGFSVTAGGQIVVSEAWSGASGLSSSSTFSVTAAGDITQISTRVPNQQSGACWTAVIGNFVYETNTASGNITQYSVATDGTLTVVGNGNAGAAGGPGAGSTDLAPSADGKYLYVHNGTGALSIFSVAAADGTLTKLPDLVGIPAHAVGIVAR